MLYMQNAPVIIGLIYFVPRANREELPMMITSYIQVSVLDTVEFLHVVQLYKYEQCPEQNIQICLSFLNIFIWSKLIFFSFPLASGL